MVRTALAYLYLLLSPTVQASPSDQETLSKLIDVEFQIEDDPRLAEKNSKLTSIRWYLN